MIPPPGFAAVKVAKTSHRVTEPQSHYLQSDSHFSPRAFCRATLYRANEITPSRWNKNFGGIIGTRGVREIQLYL